MNKLTERTIKRTLYNIKKYSKTDLALAFSYKDELNGMLTILRTQNIINDKTYKFIFNLSLRLQYGKEAILM